MQRSVRSLCVLALLLSSMTAAFAETSSQSQPLPPDSKKQAFINKKQASKTPELFGPCSNADVLSIFDGKLGKQAAADVLHLIRRRIYACQQAIDVAIRNLPPPAALISTDSEFALDTKLPTPQPLPTDPCTLSNKARVSIRSQLLRYYEILGFCTQWAAAQGYLSPAPASTPTVPPLLFGPIPTLPPPGEDASRAAPWKKAVYVLALAADAPTSSQIVFQMTERLNNYLLGTSDGKTTSPQPDPFSQLMVTYQLVPAPTWTLAQFQQQCFNDPSTAGAIVALQPSTASASWNWVLQGSFTKIEWSMMTVDCMPTSTSYLSNAGVIKWTSARPQSNQGTRRSFSLATALAIVSAIVAWHPTHSTTYDYASPNPTPAPGSTYPASYTTTTYPNGWIGAAAIGAAAFGPLSSTNIGQGAGIDKQTSEAIANNLPAIISDLLTPCSASSSSVKLYQKIPQCRWLSPTVVYVPSQTGEVTPK